MTTRDRFITTVDEFDEFVLRDENIERNFEYIAGKVVEKMVSNDIPGLIAARIIIHIGIYLEDNDIGEVFADSTGFMVNGERYIPDASYLSYEKHPDVLGVAYRPDPPDLAIEVVSSERKSEQAILRVKIHNYLVAGTVVWVIDPYLRQVEIYRTGENTQVLSENAMLVEENLLPNFKLEISKLFKRLPE